MTRPGADTTITIDGRAVSARPGVSLVQARLEAGLGADIGVGCFGQGSCGSCRALVRSGVSGEVRAVLACETTAEDGMVVAFLAAHGQRPRHTYDLAVADDGWAVLDTLLAAFPEAERCRHCGGCDATCPRHIPVERAVADAVAGRLSATASAFDDCVMCDLCTVACPELIAPNHLGVFVRRMLARRSQRPPELIARLREIERGVTIDLDCVDPDPEPG